MGQVAADLQKKNQAMHDKQAFRDGIWNFASNMVQAGLEVLKLPIEEPRRWPALTTKGKDCLRCQKYERGTFCYQHK